MTVMKKIGICFILVFSLLFVSCQKDVVGIAWRADTDSEFYTNVAETLEDLGIAYVMVPQVKASGLPYDGDRVASTCVAPNDYLIQSYADIIKSGTYKNSNVKKAMKHIKAVIFTGGEDISPTLYKTPEPWHGIADEQDYNVTRDVSDYLLMSYCLDNDIPILGLCRGAQMLGVISGATVIQDIPTFFEKSGLTYSFEHRNNKATPDSYRDYAPHTVTIDSTSTAYSVYGTTTLAACPSWHHQAIKSVSGTALKVTGTTPVSGLDMTEIVEYPGKKFAVGLQFHPEAAYVKNLKNAANKDRYMDKETAAKIFLALDSIK